MYFTKITKFKDLRLFMNKKSTPIIVIDYNEKTYLCVSFYSFIIMAKEIERKFLVKNNSYKSQSTAHHIVQGYICSEENRVVRVRIYDEQAFITIKNKTIGFSRDEFEYSIPIGDAQQMLETTCEKPIIDKVRFVMPFAGFKWEIDEFCRENEGLIIAEIELPDENTSFKIPDFIGSEVTGDARYYNANLYKHPFKTWINQ